MEKRKSTTDIVQEISQVFIARGFFQSLSNTAACLLLIDLFLKQDGGKGAGKYNFLIKKNYAIK